MDLRREGAEEKRIKHTKEETAINSLLLFLSFGTG